MSSSWLYHENLNHILQKKQKEKLLLKTPFDTEGIYEELQEVYCWEWLWWDTSKFWTNDPCMSAKCIGYDRKGESELGDTTNQGTKLGDL